MDMYTFALSIAYTNKAIKAAELEGFKVQVETTRDILETVGEEKTFYFLPKVVSEPQNGYDEYIYVNDSWELMGSTDIDLSGYMNLAPLNPTAAQIEAMPSGQLYGDTANHKGIIKGGQEFYDTGYIDDHSVIIITPETVPESVSWNDQIPNTYAGRTGEAPQFALWAGYIWYLYGVDTRHGPPTYEWDKVIGTEEFAESMKLATANPNQEEIEEMPDGQIYYSTTTRNFAWIKDRYGLTEEFGIMFYASKYIDNHFYTKAEINSMIGDIEAALSEV